MRKWLGGASHHPAEALGPPVHPVSIKSGTHTDDGTACAAIRGCHRHCHHSCLSCLLRLRSWFLCVRSVRAREHASSYTLRSPSVLVPLPPLSRFMVMATATGVKRPQQPAMMTVQMSRRDIAPCRRPPKPSRSSRSSVSVLMTASVRTTT